MAKFKVKKFKQAKRGWKETIIDRINQGKVLPFISNVVSNNLVFGSHNDVVESWADSFEYPLKADHRLTHMTQFESVMSKADPDIKADDVYIKEMYLEFIQAALFSMADEDLLAELQEDAEFDRLTFSDMAHRLNYPPFDDGQENPLLLLADLPLPIYLTTSYHNFIEIALEKAGKQPHTEICYWSERLNSIPSVFGADKSYRPGEKEPLVYHLHGLDAYPNSLVLTEDDHLDFLVTISRDMDAIPVRVRQALADSSLLMLGYGLRNWDFRVLFRGLIKTSTNERRPKSVSIQLAGSDKEKNYLENYLAQEAEFEVYWGDTRTFLQELWQGWSG